MSSHQFFFVQLAIGIVLIVLITLLKLSDSWCILQDMLYQYSHVFSNIPLPCLSWIYHFYAINCWKELHEFIEIFLSSINVHDIYHLGIWIYHSFTSTTASYFLESDMLLLKDTLLSSIHKLILQETSLYILSLPWNLGFHVLLSVLRPLTITFWWILNNKILAF
jgi:hypothetical protein